MNNNSTKIMLPTSCTHPPRPLLLLAKEGGVEHSAPLCEAERRTTVNKLAIGLILGRSEIAGVANKGVSSYSYIIDI